MQEAVSHLNRGMVLVDSLPPSVARDAQELEFRTPLGMAWLALKGWSAREVWASLHPALSLAKSLGRHDALLRIYYGLWSDVVASGRLAESLTWGKETLETAEATGHSDLLVVAHQMMCVTHFWLGNLLEARKHAERVKGSYREEHHRHLVDLMNIDPTSMVAVYDSASAWMLGHPNSATHINEANLASARRRNHPFDLGYVLSFGQLVLHFHADYAPILMRCEEAEHLSRAYSLPVISEVIAPLMKGLALVRAANIDEGVPHLQRTLDAWQNMGSAIAIPYWRTVQAEGLALSGDIVGGLHIIELSLAQIARPGWEERAYLAEILRLKGWMLERQGDFEGAEQNYQSSLTWAREQQAKSWELRTATSLARLWQGQGKPTEAHALLASIYDWFTEGFDTKDLKEAKALIEELSNVEHLES